MIKICSVSGGKTSAYIAANYKHDDYVFALVRVEDNNCRFPDEKIRKQVEDRIEKDFIGTVEDDTIIYTLLDLEQYIGQEIKWVSGKTFDYIVEKKGGWLPNKLHRYCTTNMKLVPIFEYVWSKYNKPVKMSIGFRANEVRRANKMMGRLNDDGLSVIKHSFEKHKEGRFKGKNKWEEFAWQRPIFPLIEDRIFKDNVESYWSDKPVRFAELNNCVGCFHRNPMLLKLMQTKHPEKFDWFASKEGGDNGYWRSDVSYDKIKSYKLIQGLGFDDFTGCDSGYCGF